LTSLGERLLEQAEETLSLRILLGSIAYSAQLSVFQFLKVGPMTMATRLPPEDRMRS
jgi:hypothetical protein